MLDLVKSILGQHVKGVSLYVIGGVLTVVVDLIFTWLGLKLSLGTLFALTLGTGVGLAFNYMFHAYVTFSSVATSKNFGKFIILIGLNYLTMLAVVYGLTYFTSVSTLIAKLLSFPIIAINGYLLGKYWIFTPVRDASSN